MSRYAVYKLFDGSAPGNIVSCGHLAGVLVGKYDENPLYMCPPAYMCPQTPDALQCRVQAAGTGREGGDGDDTD